MRRNFISPEFKYNKVFGTLSMEEESSFFGSKMLEIEDALNIRNENVIYFQNQFNEQLNLEIELDFPAVVYNINDDKNSNHSIKIDELQTDFEKNGYTKWIVSIKIMTILKNWLFATLKSSRTFEGIKNEMTYNQNIDIAVKDYIDKNILNRYKFNSVDLFIVPADILSNNILKYNPIWDTSIGLDEYKFTKFSTATDLDTEEIKLFFSQSYLSTQYTFRYYFNLNFEKL